jgi:predicted DsbA family dithiol-disulfide isomerase
MSLPIRIVFDFSCPYCYLAWGYIRKSKHQASFIDEWMTWQIHPDVPQEGRDIRDVVPNINIEERRRKLNTLGAAVGLAPGDKVFVPNTRLPLETVEFAGKYGKQAQWVDAVFQASFVENRNIGDLAVVLDLAKQIGLDAEELRQTLEEGCYTELLREHDAEWTRRQVEWVPTIFVDDAKIIEGAFSFEAFEETIQNTIKKRQ